MSNIYQNKKDSLNSDKLLLIAIITFLSIYINLFKMATQEDVYVAIKDPSIHVTYLLDFISTLTGKQFYLTYGMLEVILPD